MSITSQTVNAQLQTPNSPSSQLTVPHPNPSLPKYKYQTTQSSGWRSGGGGASRTYENLQVFQRFHFGTVGSTIDICSHRVHIAFTSRSHGCTTLEGCPNLKVARSCRASDVFHQKTSLALQLRATFRFGHPSSVLSTFSGHAFSLGKRNTSAAACQNRFFFFFWLQISIIFLYRFISIPSFFLFRSSSIHSLSSNWPIPFSSISFLFSSTTLHLFFFSLHSSLSSLY